METLCYRGPVPGSIAMGRTGGSEALASRFLSRTTIALKIMNLFAGAY